MNNLVEKSAAWISALATSALILSITYDYGFLTYLGLSFRDLPTNLSDHIRTSLIWGPTFVIGVICVLLFEGINSRIEGGATEIEIITRSSNPTFVFWLRRSPLYLILAVAISVPILAAFGVLIPIEGWQFSVVIIWFSLHNWVIGHEGVSDKISPATSKTVRWVPPIMFFVAFQGAIDADRVLHKNSMEYVFHTSGADLNGTLLRAFSEFYLVYDPASGSYLFVPREGVAIKRREVLNRK